MSGDYSNLLLCRLCGPQSALLGMSCFPGICRAAHGHDMGSIAVLVDPV